MMRVCQRLAAWVRGRIGLRSPSSEARAAGTLAPTLFEEAAARTEERIRAIEEVLGRPLTAEEAILLALVEAEESLPMLRASARFLRMGERR